MLLSCACGGGETATDSKAPVGEQSANADSSTLDEEGVGNGAIIDSQPDSSVADSSVPEIDPIYFDIRGWQDDMFLGCINNNGEATYGAINSKGEIIFTVGDDQYFAGDLDDDETKVFYGDFALLKDNTVINRKGETVFKLADTDFDAIYYSECMDVGYILCSKEVNTFEETGTHYYAVKLADGSSFKFEGDMKPMSPGHYYYFGNGIFIYSPANSGFGTKHTFYNLLTKEEYQGYKLDENEEKVYEYLPDLYFYGGFKGDSSTKPTVNGHFIAKSKESIVDYDLATGYCKITDIKDILEVESVMSDKDAKAPYIFQMKYSGESYGSEKFMIDIRTGKYLSMNAYKSYEIYSYNKGVGYLATVTNEGGGNFVTVIKEDGERAFDPIAIKSFVTFNDSQFLVNTENGVAVYNWKGEKIKELDTYSNRCTLGNSSMLVMARVDEKDTYILYTNDGKEVNVSAAALEQNLYIRDINGYVNGFYVFENVLVNEKGEITITQMN